MLIEGAGRQKVQAEEFGSSCGGSELNRGRSCDWNGELQQEEIGAGESVYL